MYRRKFRERLGELTPRNLDHPVPDGLVDIGGRRALIYGNPWRGLSSHPVPVLHPTDCKGNNQQHCSLACRVCGWSCTDFPLDAILLTQRNSTFLQCKGNINLIDLKM